MLNLNERIRASPYYPALVHPVFRRVLPGAAASALGDGMSAVAIAWLALKLARSSLLILAAPIGTALGGPLVAALGARGTLLASALATIALALITTAILARARARAALRR